MRRPIINGTLLPIATKVRQNFDPNRGVTVTQEFESAGDNLGGLANQFLQSRVNFDHVPNGRRSSLVATATGPQLGYPEIPVDTWQLICNEVQKDVREHPNVLAMIADEGQASLQDVEQAVKDYQEQLVPVDDSWFTDTDTAGLLFRALIHGVTSYQLGQYVLRHTTNVSNVYDSNVADLHVETIYSTSDLVFEISNASYWYFPCPGRLINKIERIENQIGSSGVDDLIWGWRKLPSQETTAANCRIDISTEYWLGGHLKLTNNPL